MSPLLAGSLRVQAPTVFDTCISGFSLFALIIVCGGAAKSQVACCHAKVWESMRVFFWDPFGAILRTEPPKDVAHSDFAEVGLRIIVLLWMLSSGRQR